MGKSKGVTFEAYPFRHDDLLSNVLSAIVVYRKSHGDRWPKRVLVKAGRFSASGLHFGADTEVVIINWGMPDTFYFQDDEYLETDSNPERIPTVFEGKRKPVTSSLRKSVRSRPKLNE